MLFINISKWVDSFIKLLSRFMGIIGICVLVLMMLFTVLNIIMRAFFNHPIPGDVELIEVGMVCVGFLGLAWCAIRGMHIGVDLLVSFLPRRIQSIFDCFGYLISLGIVFLLTWQAVAEGLVNREMNILSSTLGFPMWPFYLVCGIGYGVFCLAIAALLVKSLAEAVKR